MATATERQPHHAAARLSAGLALAVVIVIAVVAIIVALANPTAIANRVMQKELPSISRSLGRQVTVGHVEIGWFPVRVVLHQLRVAGGPGEPPLLVADTASVSPHLWPLLKSRGTDLRVRAIHLNDVDVNLVKLPNGQFDLPQQQPAPQPAPKRQLAIGSITLDRGALRLFQSAQSTAPDETLALTDIHFSAKDVAPGQPLRAQLDAAFAPPQQGKQNVHAKLELAPLPTDFATVRTKPPRVTGQLQVEGVQLAQLRALLPASAQGMIQGGAVGFQANLNGGAGKPIVLSGQASLQNASLRGKPASGSFAFDANLAPANPNDAELAIKDLKLNGPGIDLGGNATAQLAQKRARFQLSGSLLDLDTLLGVLPQKPAAQPRSASAGLSAQVRQELEALDVAGSLAVNKVVVHKLQATGLKAQARLEQGALVLSQATAQLYGGTLDASGAQIDLTQPAPRWSLKARLQGVDMGVAMQQTTGQQPLTGKANGELDLAGVGSQWSVLRKDLTGTGALTLADAALPQSSLGAQLAGPLKSALPGKVGQAASQAAAGTRLQDLAMEFSVKDGFIHLNKPLTFTSDFGSATLGGRVGLDWQLDLSGDIAVPPMFLAQLSGGQLNPSGPTKIPVKLGGTLTHPALQPSVDPPQLASGLLGATPAGKAAQKGVNQARKSIENQARRGLQQILRP